jgi:hypothetical protein
MSELAERPEADAGSSGAPACKSHGALPAGKAALTRSTVLSCAMAFALHVPIMLEHTELQVLPGGAAMKVEGLGMAWTASKAAAARKAKRKNMVLPERERSKIET